MSCLDPSYNPNPTRAWSRVENQCAYNNSSSANVFIPLLNKTVPITQAEIELQILAKGNVLQYKKNSSNLTKNQRYAQIVKGKWTNRTTTWATQTDKYSNPNTTSLQRVNYTTITLPSPPNPQYYCPSATIKNGGSLVCNTTVDPCTDKIIAVTKLQNCAPTTASNVPGIPMILCYNNGFPTYYPHRRLTMSNSGNKWPTNYKLFTSANGKVSMNG